MVNLTLISVFTVPEGRCHTPAWTLQQGAATDEGTAFRVPRRHKIVPDRLS
jgi:hypothetical protein